MSKDASLFPIYFFDCDMFCEKCAHITKFKIFSQEKYDKNYGKNEIPANKPLFCRCTECEDTVIYATNEFAELQEDPTIGLCKIWGMGTLEAGDHVFHPTENLCVVENVNRVYGAESHVTLINGKKEKIELPFQPAEGDTNAFYRLFPQNSEDARVGDLIYNTKTETISEVIGLEFNGAQTIVAKLETGEIVKYRCDSNEHYLTDEVLELNAKWRCEDLPYSKHLQVSSVSKVLKVDCLVPDFKAVCELNNIISSIPQTRCFITHIAVRKDEISSNDIYKELIRNCIYLCYCNIEFKNQEVYIAGFYSQPAKDTQKKIYRVLSKFAIGKINLDIKMRADIKNIKTFNETNHFIKISKMGKSFHIDGWVKSEKEKRNASIKAFFRTFSFRVENHLLVME